LKLGLVPACSGAGWFEKILIRIRGITIIRKAEKKAGCPKVAATLIP